MRRYKQTSITTETREIFIVRRNYKTRLFLWCVECQNRTEWLSLTENTKINSFSLREVFRLVETGTIHFQETEEGQPLVCMNSLASVLRV